MRVQVFDGDGTTLLGFGQMVGEVTTYFIVKEDGSLVSRENAEERPTDEEVRAAGGELEISEGNPKIVLDDGRVVYGCQVWWHEYHGDN